jgi:acetyl-CoA C-acetyltransferase
MENMSRAPFLLQGVRQGYKYGDQKTVDALIHDGLWCPFENCAMGESAEYIAAKCGVSRADQDRFSAQSHQRAAAAWAAGAFANEIVPVTFPAGGKKPIPPIERDEGIRADTTADTLAKLRPAFRTDGGTVTAGNASQLSDGAAAVVVASGRFVEENRPKPLARIVAYSMSGVEPRDIFIAPVPAVNAVCAKAKVAPADIDLWELNEAFAAQMLACGKELKLDESKVNIHGGAVALGHPIGASGARVLTTLVHALHRHKKRLGLAALCLGGGNAVAIIVERV